MLRSFFGFINPRILFLIMIPSFLFSQVIKKGVTNEETTAPQGHTFALVVGISQYINLPKLQFADKDAQYFREFLKESSTPADSSNLAPEGVPQNNGAAAVWSPDQRQ